MAAFSGPRSGRGVEPTGDEIASYSTYAEAQRAVDHLSDQSFDVKAVTIVGTDLKLIERITGRLNYPRAALSGAATGAWFGLFVGVVLALLSEGDFVNTLLFAVLIGAGFGMLFGVIAYALTGGRRDFTSSSQVVATSFSVLCRTETAGRARQLLQSMQNPGSRSPSQAPTTPEGTESHDAFRRPQGPAPTEPRDPHAPDSTDRTGESHPGEPRP